MSRISGKNTKPEVAVRKLVFKLGYRYRLHKKELPGKPDLVFSKLKKVIFVNGCFWHSHNKCSRAKLPKTNHTFWARKIKENKFNDIKNQKLLNELGWQYLVIWQCELKSNKLEDRIKMFLSK